MALIIFVFLFLHSHLFFTLADQMSEPLARSEELNRSFLGRHRSAITTGVAAVITLACIILFKTNKQRASTEGSCRFPIEVLRRFSFGEIRSATGNFSPTSFIERREFGVIYGGLIDDWGCKVVIKRLLFEYWDEVKALSKLRHDNLVSLIGYCNESGNMLLVYEAGMPLGTLADNLNSNTLSWEQRLRICIGVARGLDYLHTGTDHGVIHGDLKSSNILLDENYKPKISDFGLTKMDDETVLQHRQLAQKLDVCSFGVVLLELLCGGNQPELISWARSLIARGDGHFHDQIVDPRLQGQISNVCLKEFVAISKKCLHDDPKKRPTMVQLVARLELLLDNQVSGKNNATMIQGSEFLETTRGGAGPTRGETSSAHLSSLLRHRNKEPMLYDEVRQCKSMSKFEAATQNFSNKCILGSVGSYTIYRGAYLSNNKVSFYTIYRGTYMCDDTLKLEEISHLSHPNLASMVGYCCSDGKTVVGYKTEGRGNLFHQLIHSNISWVNRLDICIDAAEALRYLHMAKITHGCISPSAILLDKRYCAKLTTFGSISRDFCTAYSYRYVYVRRGIDYSTKSAQKTDIHLFGLLLYIVFCGRKTDYSRGYPYLLHEEVDKAVKSRTLHRVTDMNLDDIAGKSMTKFLQVAACCVRVMPEDRLSMDAVVEGLKEARALQIHR